MSAPEHPQDYHGPIQIIASDNFVHAQQLKLFQLAFAGMELATTVVTDNETWVK
jgi:hypothetical protein